MSRTRRLPIGRVLPCVEADAVLPAVGNGQRVILVDVALLRKTKTFLQLKENTAIWDDDAVEDYVLGLIAEGPV